MTDNGVNFLSDQPLKADELSQVKFGHEGIAETVKNIVLACPTPFTIGLFGKWGTGKSTITNLLQEKLKQGDVIVVDFDVWKYEKDSLRRTFLLSVVNAFKERKLLPEDYHLEKDLYQSFTISSEGEAKFSWVRLQKLIPYLIGSYLITALVFILIRGTEDASLTLIKSLIIPILLVLLQDVKNIVVTDSRSVTHKSIESPEQFEEKFQGILKHAKDKKVTIVVDNLDRCSHKKAIELLSTIKTFLDVPENRAKCIFVIPCDDDAIKEHLENIYGGDSSIKKDSSIKEKQKAFDPDEFLRKFFNTYVRIPYFIDTELQDYTEELLKETEVEKLDNPEVAYVITTAFRDNPRQIKQFINTLLSHYLLAKGREEGQNPLIKPEGTITKNIDFLTKLLIISHKFPRAYKKIKDERLGIPEINQLPHKYRGLREQYPDLEEFLNSTTSIPKGKIRSMRPFIYFKQSEDELKIPNSEELEIALVDNKQDGVDKEFKHLLQSPKLLKKYDRFIRGLMGENERKQTPLLNIIKSSLTALEKTGLEFSTKEYYNDTARVLGGTSWEQLRNISPSLVFSQVIHKCDKSLTKTIISSYGKILSKQSDEENTLEVTDDWAYDLFQEIVNWKDLFKEKTEEISKATADTYYSNIRILSLFKDKIDIQTVFISEELLSKFVSSILVDDIENKKIINEKFELLIDFKNAATPNVAKEIIDKFNALLDSENKKPFRPEKENLLRNIDEVVMAYHNQIEEIADENVLVTFRNAIAQGIDAIGDWNQKKIFIPTGLWLRNVLFEPHKTEINNLIVNFWIYADSEGIEYVLNNLKGNARQKIIKEYCDISQNRIVQQEGIFDVSWKFSKNEQRQELFKHIIDSNQYQWGLNKLEEPNSNLDKKESVSVLLGKVSGIPIEYKSGFYKAINDMKCGNDSSLRDTYSTQLKTLLQTEDADSQRVGYDALLNANYLSEVKRREITRETIEWLMKLEPVNHTHEYAVKSVILNWEILTPTDRNTYIHILLEKILKHSSDIADMRLSLDIIHQLKPKYEDEGYKLYFDELLARLKEEGDDSIKTELKHGLLKIKPERYNKKNKKFWGELEKI